MTIETTSPEFRAVIDTVREITIRECKKELSAVSDWLSVKDACLKLSVSRWTLYKLIDDNKIISKHIGKCVRVSNDSIDKYLNS